MRQPRLALAFTLAAAACGDASSTPDAATDAQAIDGGVDYQPLGTLNILEDRWISPSDGTSAPRSTVQGFFLSAPPLRWHTVENQGPDCVLRRFVPSSCTPVCTGDEVCVVGNTCQVAPDLASAGRLTVTGLTAPVTIDPVGKYYAAETVLPDDLFAPDATITASFAGAALPAMTMSRRGVEPLVADLGRYRVLEAGRAHTITWTPASTDDSRVKLVLNANNRGHGAPYEAIIECDVLDRLGSLSVPVEMIDAFPATEPWEVCAGSDCPPSTLTRYRRDIVDVPGGQAYLVVGSRISFGIQHAAP